MSKYENLYDLLGLDENASQSEVDEKAKEALRNSHPDRSEDTSPSQFETIKIARKVLTDKEKREKYDNLGHNKYVDNELDKPLQGYNFVSESSLSAQEKNDDSEEISDDVEDIISFSPNNSSMSGAVKQGNETSVSASKKKSDAHPVNSKKQRVEERRSEKKIAEDGAGLIVTLGSIMKDRTVKISFLIIILLGIYLVVFSIFGSLGVSFAVALSIGLFYFPWFRRIL